MFLAFLFYTWLCYAVVSAIFFIFPTLLHPKKTYKSKVLQTASDLFGKKCLHFSHRGGSREKLENTIDAFQNAIDNGSHILEFDLQVTKDGVVIVCHDANLIRLCGVHKNVSDINYADLPKFQEKVPLHFSDELEFDTKDMRNAHFPTLEETFQKFPDVIMHIDLKNNPTEVTLKVHNLIRKYKREHLTFWGNVEKERSEELRKHDPSIPSFFPAKDCLQVCLFYMIGLLPFMKLHHHSFSIPKYTVDFHKMKKRENPADRFSLFILFIKFINSISAPMIFHLKRRGILVTYWVLNHEVDFNDALNHNVNGLMTDVPNKLYKYLQEKNRYLYIKE